MASPSPHWSEIIPSFTCPACEVTKVWLGAVPVRHLHPNYLMICCWAMSITSNSCQQWRWIRCQEQCTCIRLWLRRLRQYAAESSVVSVSVSQSKIHFDAKTETYTAFSPHLAAVLEIHTELMVDDTTRQYDVTFCTCNIYTDTDDVILLNSLNRLVTKVCNIFVMQLLYFVSSKAAIMTFEESEVVLSAEQSSTVSNGLNSNVRQSFQWISTCTVVSEQYSLTVQWVHHFGTYVLCCG